MSEPDYRAEMQLPEGKTCGDCQHIKRCRAFGFTSSEANTSCDFWPSRFRALSSWAGKGQGPTSDSEIGDAPPKGTRAVPGTQETR